MNALQSLGQERIDGVTAMHLAAWHGHVACVRALHDLGVRPDLKTNSNKTPLIGAAESGYLEVIVELAKMMSSKAGMDAEDDYRMTAMRCAAKFNHKNCVLALDRYNATADYHSLVYACYFGDTESDECYDTVVVLVQLLMRPRVNERMRVMINGVSCVGRVVKIDESVCPYFVQFEGGVKSDGWFSRQVRWSLSGLSWRRQEHVLERAHV